MAILRILIIEDEPIIAMLFEELLKEMGHEVVGIAATESDAVAAARKHKPDLMFVDARLGTGNGIAAVEQILLSGFIPHIFTSGDFFGIQTQRPGAIVISKPFREPDLIRAISLALNS
jgi:two-component system, response regulator PdtaR